MQNVEDVHDKIEVVFNKRAVGDTVHYILRCSPEIRKMIHSHGDVVCLEWAKYTVRDRYHVFNYYFHCQRYAPTEKDCKLKWNSDAVS